MKLKISSVKFLAGKFGAVFFFFFAGKCFFFFCGKTFGQITNSSLKIIFCDEFLNIATNISFLITFPNEIENFVGKISSGKIWHGCFFFFFAGKCL